MLFEVSLPDGVFRVDYTALVQLKDANQIRGDTPIRHAGMTEFKTIDSLFGGIEQIREKTKKVEKPGRLPASPKPAIRDLAIEAKNSRTFRTFWSDSLFCLAIVLIGIYYDSISAVLIAVWLRVQLLASQIESQLTRGQ